MLRYSSYLDIATQLYSDMSLSGSTDLLTYLLTD